MERLPPDILIKELGPKMNWVEFLNFIRARGKGLNNQEFEYFLERTKKYLPDEIEKICHICYQMRSPHSHLVLCVMCHNMFCNNCDGSKQCMDCQICIRCHNEKFTIKKIKEKYNFIIGEFYSELNHRIFYVKLSMRNNSFKYYSHHVITLMIEIDNKKHQGYVKTSVCNSRVCQSCNGLVVGHDYELYYPDKNQCWFCLRKQINNQFIVIKN